MSAAGCELLSEESLAVSVDPPARPTQTRTVLHVINGEHYSGAERVQDLLAQRLGACGFEVGFACLKLGWFNTMREARKVPLYDVSMRGRLDVAAVLKLAKIIRSERYELVHTHTPRALLVGRLAAALARVPLIHHMHSPTARESTRGWQDRFNAQLERWALTGVAGVVAVSESLGGYVRGLGVRPKRVSVVPNGVPVQGPLPPRQPPRDSWTLGMVALFRPRKGLEVLLEALAMLRQQGLPVTLRAVGPFETPEYQAKILEEVARLGLDDAIHWVGFTRNVTCEMAKFDLFVLPSLFGEGLPMVILEAMAAGVPVVSTRVEGVPEAIREGIDGALAAPGDPHDLARAIRMIVDGELDWSLLRASAHQRQAQQFSDISMARGVAQVYRRTLGIAEVDSPKSRVELFGFKVDPVRMPEAIHRLYDWIAVAKGSCRYVVTPNVDHAVMFQHHNGLRAAYADASLVLADGWPVVAASRFLGRKLPERVAGSDLAPALFAAAEKRGGLNVYLLGAAPGVADRAATEVAQRWPAVRVVGTYSPPLGFEKDPAENERILARIAAANPDVLVIGLGAPKQELWVHAHRDRIAASVALCAGATIDFLAGEKSRAPHWMRRAGLEWLHRLASEPRRLVRRYVRDAWIFPQLVWRQWRQGV